jgi:hypothetical protein
MLAKGVGGFFANQASTAVFNRRGDAPCSTRRVLKSYFLVGRLVLVTRFRSGNTRRCNTTGLNDLLPGPPARSFAGFELSSRDLA